MTKEQRAQFMQDLLSTAFPLMVQAFMLALVSATDALMLGLVDQTSLSAVSLGGQVQFVLNLFILGITGGLSILTAQYWGKGDLQTVERLIPRNLLYMLLIGGLFTSSAALAPVGSCVCSRMTRNLSSVVQSTCERSHSRICSALFPRWC